MYCTVYYYNALKTIYELYFKFQHRQRSQTTWEFIILNIKYIMEIYVSLSYLRGRASYKVLQIDPFQVSKIQMKSGKVGFGLNVVQNHSLVLKVPWILYHYKEVIWSKKRPAI